MTSPRSEVEWVTAEADLERLGPEWDALAAGSPFDLHCWYLAWWRAFGEGAEVATCLLRQDGELAGVFPLIAENGSLRAMANVHSPSYRPLARDPEALTALAAAVLERGPVGLSCMPTEDGATEAVAAAIAAAGMRPQLEPSYSSPTVDTSGDFDAWREVSKKRWGAPLERFRRKMGRDHEAELAIVVPPSDLEAELADGYRVEASGWKGEAGTAIVSSPDTEAFYTGVAHAFAARDELRFSRVVLDGDTAAFDFTLLHDGRLHLLKTGFDESFRKLAPGLVMRLSIVERCFELGLASHELLGDESEWKAKFATGTRPHATLRAYERSATGAAKHAYRSRLRPRLRDAYRRLKRR